MSTKSPSDGPTQRSSVGLASLNRIDSLITFYSLNANEKILGDIIKNLCSEKCTSYITEVTNNSKYSTDELSFIAGTFEKVADVVAPGLNSTALKPLQSVLVSEWAKLKKYFEALHDEAIKLYGAKLWLALSKLRLSISDFKLLSAEWNDIFYPMEFWFSVGDEEILEICLEKWSSFIAFVGSKPSLQSKRSKLIAMFCKPLRSRTMISKLSNEKPVIDGYMTVIKTFKDELDEHFDEVVICFLRFLAGRNALLLQSTEDVESEIKKPIDGCSPKLVLNCAVAAHLEYLTDERSYPAFNKPSVHLFPTVCSILGVEHDNHYTDIPPCFKSTAVTKKFATFFGQLIRLAGSLQDSKISSSSICSCFSALAERIACIEEVVVKRSESRLLFLQIKSWIEETHYDLRDLENVLCSFFAPKDLSVYANTVREWPAKILLGAVLEKFKGGEIGELLVAVCGTLSDVFENSCIVLRRVDEMNSFLNEYFYRFETDALLKTWLHLAEIARAYIKETGDINEGSLIHPDFSSTFNLLRLIFEIANRAAEQDRVALMKCCSSFALLYTEVQNAVRLEHKCNAETVLSGIFGNLVYPETACCVTVYASAFSSVISGYPFDLLNESDALSAPSFEFDSLSEISFLVVAIKVVTKKVTEITTSKQEDALCLADSCRRLFELVEKPSVIRSMFLALCGPLGDMYRLFFVEDSRFKAVARQALDTYIKILDYIKKKIPAPYDDNLLSECAPFLAQLLGGMNGKRAKLRVAAAELWNKTFAQTKSLTYSEELKKILNTLVQKRVIYAPGLSRKSMSSSDISEYGQVGRIDSFSNISESGLCPDRKTEDCLVQKTRNSNCSLSASTSLTRALKRRVKRSVSPTVIQADVEGTPKKKETREDFDSSTATEAIEETMEKCVEAKPVLSNTHKKSSAVKIEQSTSSQKTTPKTRRRSRGSCLVEEDSVDYVPISSSESAKKMRLTDRQKEIFSEKRERMPFLDEDSQQIAVIGNLNTEFDLESSQSGSLCASVVVPKEHLEKCEREKDNVVVEERRLSSICVAKESDVENLNDSNTSSDTANRRRTNIKLNFNKVSDPSANAVEPNIESECSTSSNWEAELSADSDATAKMVKTAGSRRTQKKGTPTKYISKKRKSVDSSAENDRGASKVFRWRAKTNSGKIVDGLEPEQSTTSNNIAESAEDLQPLGEVVEAFEKRTSLDVSFEEAPNEDFETLSIRNEIQEPETTGKMSAAATPSFVQRVAGTPGILKKLDSPSTAEKKLRRVHFDNMLGNAANDQNIGKIEDGPKLTLAEDQSAPSPKGVFKRTPRRPFANVQANEEAQTSAQITTVPFSNNEAASPSKSDVDNDDQPIFPKLMNCQESIVKIIGKLVPISTNTGSITLRKTLEARGVVQIRHLASMSRREVAALNIKKPRVDIAFKALLHFARDYPAQERPFLGQKKQIDTAELQNISEPVEGSSSAASGDVCEQIPAIGDRSQDGGRESEEAAYVTNNTQTEIASSIKEEVQREGGSSSQEFSARSPQCDSAASVLERLKLRRDTVLEESRNFLSDLQEAQNSGLEMDNVQQRRALLFFLSGCVELLSIPELFG